MTRFDSRAPQVNMGTGSLLPMRLPIHRMLMARLLSGITSIILHNLPYQFHGLKNIATIIFALNAVLFVLFFLV